MSFVTLGRVGSPRIALWLALALAANGCHCGPDAGQTHTGVVVTPGQLDFGTYKLNAPPAQPPMQTFTVRNVVELDVTIISTDISGPAAGDFKLTAPLDGVAVGIDTPQEDGVVFAPTDIGQRQATLTLHTNSLDTPKVTVQLTGLATDYRVCATPTSIDFGDVQKLGAPATQSVQVTACGKSDVDLMISGLQGAQAAMFALNLPASLSLTSGTSATIGVAFQPSALGPATASFTASCTACDATTTIQLAGNGVDGALSLTPSPAAFGTVYVGHSGSATVTATNSGTTSITITQAVIRNAGSIFALSSPPALPATLAPGQSLPFPITVTPLVGGSQTDNIDVTFHVQDPTIPPLVATDQLQVDSVRDIHICPQPATLNFNSVQVKGTPVSQTISFQNCGQSPADMSVGAIAGAQAADFSWVGSTAQTLQPGQSLSASVKYSPSALGAGAANIPWQPCGTCSAATPIPLSGVGVDGALTFTPSPAAFGPVNVGVVANANVVATNTGTAAISISALKVRGSPSTFAIPVPPALPVNLTPGQTLTVPMTFKPTASGAASDFIDGTFAVADPAVAPRSASGVLDGTGNPSPCTLAVAPTSLSFGSVSPGSSSSRSVTLTNSGGVICQISGIQLGGGTDPYFSLVGGATTTVAIGGTTNISVTFKPTANTPPLTRTGTLVFNSNDPAHPGAYSVSLSGTVNISIYSGGWPKWHLDNFNSGQTPADTSQLTGTVAWKFNVGLPEVGTNLESPVIDGNGNAYYMAQSGTFYAVAPDGGQLWAQTLDSPIGDPHPSTPVVLASGSIFINSGEEQNASPDLYVLNSTNGAIQYSQTFGVEGFSATPGFGNDGTLFQCDDDGMPDNGGGDPYDAITFKWNGTALTQTAQYQIQFTTMDSSLERASIVIAADDTSYWCSGNQCFGMSPPTSGFTPLAAWPAAGVTFVTPDANAVPSTVTSDVAMDSKPGGYLYAYAGWETTISGAVGIAGVLTALNPSNGSIVWSTPLPAAVDPSFTIADYGNASPAVASNGNVYVGNGDGLRAINGKTGAIVWFYPTSVVTDAPAIGADGTVFFGAKDGTFYALNSGGTLRFSVKAGGQIAGSPAIANDGTVCFVADDGFLYKIQ
jgi:outer membrane protein assembly factor BamB